jgi:hypothetical protein
VQRGATGGGRTSAGGNRPLLRAAPALLSVVQEPPRLGREAGAWTEAARPTRPPPRAAAGERVGIPGGAFTAGSTPGDKGRDPTLEPALLAIDLGGFSIDRALFPNGHPEPPRRAHVRLYVLRGLPLRSRSSADERRAILAHLGLPTQRLPRARARDPADQLKLAFDVA